MKLKTLTVSQVNDYLANYIGTNPIFSNMSVGGEVFNLKKTGYGYTFLSLKDDESKLNAITYLEKFDVQEGDFIKMSLRSKGNNDVNLFARKYFNGGGHINAAGGRFDGTMEEAVTYFKQVLPDFIHKNI